MQRRTSTYLEVGMARYDLVAVHHTLGIPAFKRKETILEGLIKMHLLPHFLLALYFQEVVNALQALYPNQTIILDDRQLIHVLGNHERQDLV
jgi:hypothetical protein